MQKCEKCHMKFKWYALFKMQWRKKENSRQITCKHCETEHYLTLGSKVLTDFCAFPILVIMFYFVEYQFETNLLFFIGGSIIVYLLISLLLPFVISFKSKYHANYKTFF